MSQLLLELITTKDKWIAAERDEDTPVLVRFRPNLQAFRALGELTTEIQLIAHYKPEIISGLPDDTEMDLLDDFEDQLMEEIESTETVLTAVLTGESKRIWIWYSAKGTEAISRFLDLASLNQYFKIELNHGENANWQAYQGVLNAFEEGVYTSYDDKTK